MEMLAVREQGEKAGVSFTAHGAKVGAVVAVAVMKGKLGKEGKKLDRKGVLTEAMKEAGFKGKTGSMLDVWAPFAGVKRLIVYGIEEDELVEWENFGGAIAAKVLGGATKRVQVVVDADDEAAAHVAAGVRLGAYSFTRYKGKSTADKSTADKSTAGKVQAQVMCGDPAQAREIYGELEAGVGGALIARDLMNEPSNMLTTSVFVDVAKDLAKEVGLQVKVLDEAAMAKLGMHSLLGVGQGSAHKSYTLVSEWKGGKKGAAPLAVVGKGVCFDSGGLSLKPPAGMEDMKGDMGGAAATMGALWAMAKRKAPVNVVGLIGLVENMPSSTAQRPGDIVRAMSGTTIEVLNTDAEGRLVLADVLWYAQENYAPCAVVDMATLTGAIIISLGKTRAGLFANDDALAEAIEAAGEDVGEKVWRMPMDAAYGKLMDSKNADVKNIGGGRQAGSVTAAKFLERFVKEGVPWAHIDIAGVAMGSERNGRNRSWANGFGARLVDKLSMSTYEGEAPRGETREGEE